MENKEIIMEKETIFSFLDSKEILDKFYAINSNKEYLNKFLLSAKLVLNNNKNLQKCSKQSILSSLLQVACENLMITNIQSEAFLVPNMRDFICTPQLSYTGIIKILYNSGVKNISAKVIYSCDTFRYWCDENGQHLLHEICINRCLKDKKDIDGNLIKADYGIGAYCIAEQDGKPKIEYICLDELKTIRGKISSKPEIDPWVLYWGEMAKKATIKRLRKYLRHVSTENAIELLYSEDNDIQKEIEAQNKDEEQNMT